MTASPSPSWSQRFSFFLLALGLFIALEIGGACLAGIERSFAEQGAEILLALLAAAGLAGLLKILRAQGPGWNLSAAGLILGLVLVFILRGSFLGFGSRTLSVAALLLFLAGGGLFILLLRSWLQTRPAATQIPWLQAWSLALPLLAAAIWLREQWLWTWPNPAGQLVVMPAGAAVLALGAYGGFRLIGPSPARRLQQLLSFGLPGLLLLWTGAALVRERILHPSFASAAPAAPPPVILLTLDALRADALEQARAANPDLLADLAADSAQFRLARSASCWTRPSLDSLLTGAYPSALGAGRLLEGKQPVDWTDLPATAMTLPELLTNLGFQTVAFAGNPWLGYQFGRRFSQLEVRFAISRPFFMVYLFERVAHKLNPTPAPLEPELLTDRALRWLQRSARPPFFLWLHYLDPHLPYLKTPLTSPAARLRPAVEYNIQRLGPALVRAGYFNFGKPDRPAVRLRYQGEVNSALLEVERLIRELKRLQIYDPALIILTADHGEEFWEHGNFEHGHSFFDEVLHVPLLVKFPYSRFRGARIDTPVDLTALAPTVLAVLGQSQPPAMQGSNLIPCLSDQACPAWWMSEASLYYDEVGAYGTRDGQKIILHGDGSTDCYNLNTDPQEAKPLTCVPELIQAFQAKRQANLDHQRRFWPESVPSSRAMDPETRARLRALGYLE